MMDASSREITESPLWQGVDEEVAYTLTTTPWGSSPSNESVKLYSFDGSTFTDVTSTNLSGSASVSGDVITTPRVISLEADTKYRLEIKFTSGGNVYETWAWINGQR